MGNAKNQLQKVGDVDGDNRPQPTEARGPVSVPTYRMDVSDSVINSIGLLFFVVGASGEITRFNPECERLTGWSEAEVLGKDFIELFVPADRREITRREVRGVLQSGSMNTSEYEWVLRDGSRRMMRTHHSRLTSEEGAPEGFVGLAKDITETHAAWRALARSENRYRTLAEMVPQLIWVADGEGRLTDGNQAFVAYFDLPIRQIRRVGWRAVVAAEDAEVTRRAVEGAIASGHPFHCEHRLRDGRTGRYRWHLSRAIPSYGPDGRIETWIGTSTDIHDSRLLSNRLHSVTSGVGVGLIFEDVDGRIVFMNSAAEAILGEPFEVLSGKTPGGTGWRFIRPDGSQMPLSELPASRVRSGEGPVQDVLLGVCAGNGSERWLRVNASPLDDPVYGNPSAVISLMDVTELIDQRKLIERQNAQLESANVRLAALATTDGLTGLLNHRAIHERLTETFSIAIRHRRPMSVLMMDVDRFKQLNDRNGHLEGDRVLREMASLLTMERRAGDIVGRYGGEEFLIILPETEIARATDMAERLRQAIVRWDWKLGPVTASFGVSSLRPEIATANQLVGFADEALYVAKRRGRNQVVEYDPAFERPFDG